MLIKMPHLNDTDSVFEESGIMEPRRLLYIFIDEKDRNKPITDPSILAKATQINITVLKDERTIFGSPMSRANNISSIVTVYNYIVRLPIGIGGMRQIKMGTFFLINANKMKRESDYNFNRTFPIENSIYNKFIVQSINSHYYDIADQRASAAGELFKDQQLDAESIPEPMYYSLDEQYHRIGHAMDLRDETTNYQVSGEELIDDFCQVVVKSTKEYDSMYQDVDTLLADAQHSLSTKEGFLSEMNDSFGLNSMVNGGVMAYDTNDGWNWRGGSIINQKYMINDAAAEELNRVIDGVTARAKRVESEFGPIRLFYSPGFLGDSVQILYKDYNSENQPGKSKVKTQTNGLKQDSKFNIESFVDNKVNEWAQLNMDLDNDI